MQMLMKFYWRNIVRDTNLQSFVDGFNDRKIAEAFIIVRSARFD